MRRDLEQAANAVLAGDLPLLAQVLAETWFHDSKTLDRAGEASAFARPKPYTLTTGHDDCRMIAYALVRSRPNMPEASLRPITTRSALNC
jgi:hypothetical protein